MRAEIVLPAFCTASALSNSARVVFTQRAGAPSLEGAPADSAAMMPATLGASLYHTGVSSAATRPGREEFTRYSAAATHAKAVWARITICGFLKSRRMKSIMHAMLAIME